MAEVQELEQPIEGVAEEVSSETVPATADDNAATRQPAKVNLDGFEEFRKYKSEQDKRISQIERTHQQQLAQARAEAQQIRTQFEQSFVGGMDDEQKAAYLVQQAEARAQAAEKLLYDRNMQDERRNVLRDIAERYEVPVDALEDATDPGHARDLAWNYIKRKEKEQSEESEQAKAAREQKRKANTVDTGAGSPVAPANDLEAKLAKAFKDRDAALYNKLLRERK